MHSNRFIVKEELSVSDTVVKITNEIYTQLLNKLSIGKSFISKERNVIIKKGIFDYQTEGKLMCVPMNYFAIVYKLFNNLPLQEEDYHFDYEGLDSKYCENFYLLTDFQNN